MKRFQPAKVKLLSLILPLLFFLAFTDSGEKSTVADASTSETVTEVNIETSTTADDLTDVVGILENDNSIQSSGIFSMLSSPCSATVEAEARYCQACYSVGAYSQIDTGTPDQVTFYAYSFPQSSGCYATSSGTVTFDYEIIDNDTGQEITSGSVQRSFGSSASCYPYSYSFSHQHTNVFTLPTPGVSDATVELTTTHEIGPYSDSHSPSAQI